LVSFLLRRYSPPCILLYRFFTLLRNPVPLNPLQETNVPRIEIVRACDQLVKCNVSMSRIMVSYDSHVAPRDLRVSNLLAGKRISTLPGRNRVTSQPLCFLLLTLSNGFVWQVPSNSVQSRPAWIPRLAIQFLYSVHWDL
jgi:hypothetical protein